MKIVLDGRGLIEALAPDIFTHRSNLLITMRLIRFNRFMSLLEQRKRITVSGAIEHSICVWDKNPRTGKFEWWGMNPHSNKASI